MSINTDPNWATNTTSHSKNKATDNEWVKLVPAATLEVMTLAAANRLRAIGTSDKFTQEFVNRALTNIGFNLTITKGMHQSEYEQSWLRTNHFDVTATSTKPCHDGTNGIIYHIYTVSDTNFSKKTTALILEKISWVVAKQIYEEALGITVPL